MSIAPHQIALERGSGMDARLAWIIVTGLTNFAWDNCLRVSLSIRFQASCPESGASLLNGFDLGLPAFAQPIIDPKFVPLKPAHLMERKDIYALDDTETRREARDGANLNRIVAPAGDQHIPQPDRLSLPRQTSAKPHNRPDVHCLCPYGGDRASKS